MHRSLSRYAIMKTDELAELLLTVLAEQNGEGSHLLDALAGPLGITDRAKIREAAVSLKGQGLADVFVSLTGTDARITATGRKFVCEGVHRRHPTTPRKR